MSCTPSQESFSYDTSPYVFQALIVKKVASALDNSTSHYFIGGMPEIEFLCWKLVEMVGKKITHCFKLCLFS